MTQIMHLLALADEFERVERIEGKTLSFRVFGDSKKLAALRDGADITVGRFNAALAWFDKNWPADAVWPEAVNKPLTPERFDEMTSASPSQGEIA